MDGRSIRFDHAIDEIMVWAASRSWHHGQDHEGQRQALEADVRQVIAAWQPLFVRREWGFLFFIVYNMPARDWNRETTILCRPEWHSGIEKYLWLSECAGVPGTVNTVFGLLGGGAVNCHLQFSLAEESCTECRDFAEHVQKARSIKVGLRPSLGAPLGRLLAEAESFGFSESDWLVAAQDERREEDRFLHKFRFGEENRQLREAVTSLPWSVDDIPSGLLAAIAPQRGDTLTTRGVSGLCLTLANVACLLQAVSDGEREPLLHYYFSSTAVDPPRDDVPLPRGALVILEDGTGPLPLGKRLSEREHLLLFCSNSLLVSAASHAQRVFFEDASIRAARELVEQRARADLAASFSHAYVKEALALQAQALGLAKRPENASADALRRFAARVTRYSVDMQQFAMVSKTQAGQWSAMAHDRQGRPLFALMGRGLSRAVDVLAELDSNVLRALQERAPDVLVENRFGEFVGERAVNPVSILDSFERFCKELGISLDLRGVLDPEYIFVESSRAFDGRTDDDEAYFACFEKLFFELFWNALRSSLRLDGEYLDLAKKTSFSVVVKGMDKSSTHHGVGDLVMRFDNDFLIGTDQQGRQAFHQPFELRHACKWQTDFRMPSFVVPPPPGAEQIGSGGWGLYGNSVFLGLLVGPQPESGANSPPRPSEGTPLFGVRQYLTAVSDRVAQTMDWGDRHACRGRFEARMVLPGKLLEYH